MKNEKKLFAPPLTDEFYAESYLPRKASSSMTSAAITWFKDHSRILVEESSLPSDERGVFSVLSVGCGEGDIDLEIIRSLIPPCLRHRKRLKYVALEPNPIHRESFHKKLQQEISFDESAEIHIHDGYFGEANGAENHRYNLVLMVHVLYYFQDPYGAIQQALAQIKPKGKAVIVHQEETGIPQIQREYMMGIKNNQEDLMTTEIIKKSLIDKGHDFYYQSIDARLDITECLAGSEEGIKIMSFCMECDLRYLVDFKLDQLTQAFRSIAVFNETGQAFINEPIGILILPSFPE